VWGKKSPRYTVKEVNSQDEADGLVLEIGEHGKGPKKKAPSL